MTTTTKDADSKSIALKVGFWVLVVAILIFNLFPAIYALVSSFRPSQDLFSTQVLPRALTFDHYKAVFADADVVGGKCQLGLIFLNLGRLKNPRGVEFARAHNLDMSNLSYKG